MDMTNAEVTHYADMNELGPKGACGIDVYATPYAFGALSWPEVTCDACKLEEPAAAPTDSSSYFVTGAGLEVLQRDAELSARSSLADATAVRRRAGIRLKAATDAFMAAAAAEDAAKARLEARGTSSGGLTPQSFMDDLAGFAERQWAGRAPWHP